MKPAPLSTHDADAAADLLHPEFLARLRRHDEPADALAAVALFLCRALAIHAESAKSNSQDRALAGYSLARIVRESSRFLGNVLPASGGRPETPDCGMLVAVHEAVSALHSVARANPNFFKIAAHYHEWPALVATNGKILAKCLAPHEVGLLSIVQFPEKTKRLRGDRKPDPSALLTGIAQEMIYYAAMFGAARDLSAMSARTLKKWKRSVKAALKERKADILSREAVQLWAKGIKGKEYVAWNKLETEVLKKVSAFAKG